MVAVIFSATFSLYYIGRVWLITQKFQQENKTITLKTASIIPWYLVKVGIQTRSFGGVSLARKLKTVLSIGLTSDISLAILMEVLDFHTDGKEKITYKDVFNQTVMGDTKHYIGKYSAVSD